jgi:hypothetical protein
MIKQSFFFISFLFLLLSSCSYISYSQVIPLIDKAIFGADDIPLTQEFISSKEYSFVKVELGKSSVSIMTLRSIKEGVFEWISQTGERIYTYNGKVVKTEGLPFDTYIYSFRQKNFLQVSSSMRFHYYLQLYNPKAFVEQTSFISVIEDSEDYLVLKEEVQTDGFKWNFSNKYSYNKLTQLPIETSQYIHPKLDPIVLTFIYK